jgi:ABC-type multidrug transport system fused ATPase/permease subunit
LAQDHSVLGTLLKLYRLMTRRRKQHFWLAVLLMLVGGLAELVTIGAVIPFLALLARPEAAQEIELVRFVFDLFGWDPAEAQIVRAGLLVAGAAIFAAAVRLALMWSTQGFAFQFGHEIGVAIYARMLRQPYLQQIQRNSSEAIAAVEKVQTMIFGVLLPVVQGVVAFFLSVLILGLLVAMNPVAAVAAAVIIGVLYLLLSLASQRWLRSVSHTMADAHTARVKQVQEGLGGIRDILLDASQPVFERAFAREDGRMRRAQVLTSFISSFPRIVIETAGILLIMMLATYLAGKEGGLLAVLPELGAMALGAQKLLPLVQQVYVATSRTAGSMRSLQEITAMALAPLPPLRTASQVDGFTRELRLEAVGFTYPGGADPALRGIDLVIGRGERIGLLGETGSGKSTLLDVVMGLLEPTEGRVLVDGVPLNTTALDAWQARIAHVPQFIYLSDSSIASNIAFGEETDAIDMERVREAAALACIADFVDRLPERYETRVGERGVRLSGGQRQRIGIARALYKQASLLILDEATSALDDETEAAVIDVLLTARPDLTILMVAHRLTTLAGCDRLVRLRQGTILESGSYAELVEQRRQSRRSTIL